MSAWMVPLLTAAAGLFLLWKGGEWLVDGASALAKRLGVAPIVIGLTVVAFGTSAPELAVGLIASFEGRSAVVFGNVIGSNVANVLLILGVVAAIAPVAVKRATAWREIPFAFFTAALVCLLAADGAFTPNAPSVIGGLDGGILLVVFAFFIYYTFAVERAECPKPEIGDVPARGAVLRCACGLLALGFGGSLTVDGAVGVARTFGVSEALIGLTLVAVGTSLPELVASAVAARRGQTDIAVGNIIGSNVFNATFILGASALARPIGVSRAAYADAVIAALVTCLLFLVLHVRKRREIGRAAGVLFILLYATYVAIRIFLG